MKSTTMVMGDATSYRFSPGAVDLVIFATLGASNALVLGTPDQHWERIRSGPEGWEQLRYD